MRRGASSKRQGSTSACLRREDVGLGNRQSSNTLLTCVVQSRQASSFHENEEREDELYKREKPASASVGSATTPLIIPMTVHSSTQASPIRVAVVYVAPPHPQLRILTLNFLSGAGMGGLVLALFIQKYCPAIQVDIYESTAGLTEVGVGIGMYPRVWEVVRFLGLEADILEASGDVPCKCSMLYSRFDTNCLALLFSPPCPSRQRRSARRHFLP